MKPETKELREKLKEAGYGVSTRITKTKLVVEIMELRKQLEDLENKYKKERQYSLLIEYELFMLKKEIYDGRNNRG